MRTKTIARWRRAALAGALATSLALPVVAQEQPAPKPEEMEGPGPKPDALEQPAQPPPQKRQKPQRGENAPVITEQGPRPPPELNLKPVPGVTPVSPDFEVVRKGGRLTSNNTVSVSGKLAFTPPPVVTVRTSGLVSPDEVRHAGRIDASFEEKQMLATYDTAYVRFRGEVPAKPGDKLVIFRPDGEIRHPFTNRKLADRTRTLGIVNVLSVTGNQPTVQLERVFEQLERGDLVKLYTSQDNRLTPRANTADI